MTRRSVTIIPRYIRERVAAYSPASGLLIWRYGDATDAQIAYEVMRALGIESVCGPHPDGGWLAAVAYHPEDETVELQEGR